MTYKKPTIDEWKRLAEKELRGKSVEGLYKRTAEEIDIKPVYGPDVCLKT